MVAGISYAKGSKLIPIENFAGLPSVSTPKLSPDGKHIIALSPIDGEQLVVVTDFGSIELTPVVKLKKEQNRVESMRWLNNERILVATSYNKLIYNRRIKLFRMFAVNIDGSKLTQLELPSNLRDEYTALRSALEILSYLPKDDEHILVQSTTNRDKTPAVFKFNIYDNTVDKIVTSTEQIDDWGIDENGSVIFGIRRDFDKSTEEQTVDIFYRKDESSQDWKKIYSYRSFRDFYIAPVILSEDKKSVIVFTDYEMDKTVLRKFDIEKQEFSDIIFEVDGYDVNTAYFADGKISGIGFIDDYYRIDYIDPELKARQKMIEKTFAKYQSYIVSTSKDKNRLIVSASTSDSPYKYFLVDLATKKVNFWLSQYPGLEKKSLPAKEKYQFKSRDGLTINGYLTPGSKGAKSPLVVFPHGGPFARDDQHFDLWVQMLARRGYAVLQINFRGSEGFSNSFESAGYQQYGKAMQNDVYDAITWVNKNKKADTNNMCLVGASYGGYVAQVAAFQKPKEFKCFISIAGISDLAGLVKTANLWQGANLSTKTSIGDITDENQLKDIEAHSSINHVEKFSTPILLIHGEYDQVVKIAQSEDLYKALKKRRKKVKFIELEKGTHNVDNPENRIIAFKAIDKFLTKYLD